TVTTGRRQTGSCVISSTAASFYQGRLHSPHDRLVHRADQDCASLSESSLPWMPQRLAEIPEFRRPPQGDDPGSRRGQVVVPRLSRSSAPRSETGGPAMRQPPTRVSVLRIAVLLAALFELFALVVLVWFTPIQFTLFMFFGELLFGVALLLLVGAVLADLRAKQLLPWGPDRPETGP